MSITELMTHKTIKAPVTKADGRTRTFCISTGSVDRDNDTIDVGGWDFRQWLKNPVVLPSHAYDEWPIARGANLRRQGDGWLADFTFAESPEADAALALVDAGMLNACSVGFRPLESTYDSVRQGTNFVRQELLEVSICAVPANPEALVQRAASLGLSADVVRKVFGPRASKVGARHSQADQDLLLAAHQHLHVAHDYLVGLGAECDEDLPPPPPPADDGKRLALTLDDEEILTLDNEPPPARRAAMRRRRALGDPPSDPAARHDEIDIDPEMFADALTESVPAIAQDIGQEIRRVVPELVAAELRRRSGKVS